MPIPLFEPLHPVQIAALKNMSDATKLEIVQNLIDTARSLKKSQFMTNHPEWSEEKLQSELKNIFLYTTT